ncbi:hypothetical protein F5H01DRAFT_330780 [Linnemannia elongata]|nr:hypothetical protein F5H01DRAFT_330780 [Linnemannia elongata]
MSSAGTRFFNIAELTDMVTERLNKHDISTLAQTSRRLLEHCEPLLYMDLRLNYKPNGHYLFDCRYSTLALARNIHYVKKLRISIINLALLADCMRAHLRSIGAKKQDLSLDSLFSHRSITTSSSFSHVVPVPPMANLERLETTLVRGSYASTCFYYLKTDNNPKNTLRQFCLVLDLSPRLTYLKAEWISISNAIGLRLLSTSLSVLACLETLILDDVVADNDDWACIGRTIFNSSCPSVRVLLIKMSRPLYSKRSRRVAATWSKANHVFMALDRASPAIRDRLHDLTMWSVAFNKDSSDQELSSILKRCPNLKRLTFPGTLNQSYNNNISQLIEDHCPKVSSLAFVDWTHYGRSRAPIPTWVMTHIPAQRIEEFKWTGFLEEITLARAQLMFNPHSQVLRKIVFEQGRGVHGGAIKVILTECPALEHFQAVIEDFKCTFGSTIMLSDAIADPWVCTKLKVLDLAISMPDMSRLAPGQDPYYKRAPIVELGDVEVELLGQLEKLYFQIGLLTDLTHLALRAVIGFTPGYWQSPYHDVTMPFPALLNLQEEQTGRPGYLDLLRGLTQLEELRGSVNTNSEETKVTVGWEEVRWMARYWPNLRVVAFAKDESELREPFVWLQKELDLIVDADPFFQW